MDKDVAVMELLQCIKAEPDDEMDTNDSNANDLMMSAEAAGSKSTNRLNKTEIERSVKQNGHPLSSASQGSGLHPSSECLNQEIVVNYIKKVENRVTLVSTKMDKLLNSITSSRGCSRTRRSNTPEAFEFSPITGEDELIDFDKQLEEKEYFEKMLDWANNRRHGFRGPQGNACEELDTEIDGIGIGGLRCCQPEFHRVHCAVTEMR
ncbi:hypothetical protein ZHAS_00012439 [Anopheles sinensis]|uniref:Uncharacterized protein n=1 Tax=Anopheles sinensis TaxID=74873 RepID=A0A084W2W5_ANOSI|nr:hypothetical protein ZHAS_00012439 [Anopheles sinensis]